MLSLVDDKVWNIYANGLTTSINQADSEFARPMLKRYKPQSLAELSAWVAGIRPGFASLLDNFLDRKPYTTGVPELDFILSDSFHYMMYQESIMKFLVWLGIEEKGTYDIIKKISKKKFKPEELEKLHKQLEQGWIDKVGTLEGFKETWQVIEDATRYSFNACIAGDTIIQKSGMNNKSFNPTIEEMFLIKNDIDYAKKTNHLSLHKKYKNNGYGNALSMGKDGRIYKNKIVDIRFNDIKDIYRVTTTSGAYIDCTLNHKFPTPNGKKKLEDLSIGDLLFVKDKYEKHPDDYRFTNGDYESNVPRKGEKGFQKKPNGNSVRFGNMLKYKQDSECLCEICGKKYDGSKFELHHIDMDRTNNDSTNLIWLCNSCHKKEHYKNGRKKIFEKGIPTRLEEIVSIEFIRTDKTYDVEMEAPNYTYVSETGLVTSNSHSLCVALDSIYGAYLKSHYPLEYFTVALSMYSGDMERTANLTDELKYFGIQLNGIKFGKSASDYTMDKETNSIYKGIASIKYCNAQIADELLELSKNKYNNFIDLLSDINTRCTINSRQLNILIGLNFFSEFGKNKYLMKVVDIYNKFNNCKIVSKKNLNELEEKYGLSEYFMVKYSGKETKTQYREIDNIGLITALCNQIPNKCLSLKEQIEFEKDNLGYVEYSNPKIPDYYWIVTDFKTYQDKNKPYISVRNLNTGEEIRTKVKQAKVFRENPFGLYSILIFEDLSYQNKHKKINDRWIETNEKEAVLTNYEVLNKEMA